MSDNNINIHIRNVQNGDLNAFRFLIDNYKQMAMSIALRILKNRDDAQDAVQESFILAYQNIQKYNFSTKFSTWFYKIVLNKSLSIIRKSKPEFISIDEDPAIEEIPDDEFDHYDSELIQKIIESAIERLNDNEAIILRLYYYDDLKVEEIAKLFEVTYTNAKVILHRARLKLKKILMNEFKSEMEERL
ncbi:MAG: sigma-70 family RNA polymerase sigma factor [Candidatus Kapabacteria bacterium]|nr:sigma-70 family RNA polymerase sigma factor [Ignavibacteriota bacterium]MCW5883875.1 sigma-70 family RNA polymerase sigma factor [Candidatus Kapabacteria bacterium]